MSQKDGGNIIVQLQLGDCLEKMKALPDNSIDMILCDLPYGTTNCKWDSIIPLKPLWSEYKRLIKLGGTIVLFAAQPFTTNLITSNLKDFCYCWYWHKNNKTGGIFCKRQPMRCIEDICVFIPKSRAAATYNPQGLKVLNKPIIHKAVTQSEIYNLQSKNPSIQRYTNYPCHLLEFKGTAGKRLHPTQKPVELLEYLVNTYTKPSDTVLDNCMGSGSTGVACVNTNRNFIGIEKDEKYYNIAKKRIEQAIMKNKGG